MVSISTYGGWAGIALIGAGYWYLQSRRTTTRTNRPVPQKQANKPGDARKDGKSKKNRSEGPQSGGEQSPSSQEKRQKKKKQKIAYSTLEDTKPEAVTTVQDTKEDDHANNQEFARQFQNAKSGTISSSRPQLASHQKSVKQSQAKDTSSSNNINGVETSSDDVSKASSTAGVDGDDDLSAANSPALEATKIKTLRSGDVSDMLESPTPGPSVLRITEPATSSQLKKERKPTQSPETIETKKQRQNRKKAEAKKEAREEQEKERRILLEKQRRTAREAEGRAAKDGRAFMAAKAPTSSAWTAPSSIENGQTASTTKNVELLDTYEPATNGVSKSPPSIAGAVAVSDEKVDNDWDKAMPSEEEQMRLLEEEMAWNTVTSKKGKKKTGESEQVSAQKVVGNEKTMNKVSKDSTAKTVPINAESQNTGPVTIVGDPSIDISNFSYKGGPVNAVLENGDGKEYGYTMADDEWEVA
jgi:hypothetical protein